MPFANKGKIDEIIEKIRCGAWGEKREGKEMVVVVRDDLKMNGGVRLVPGGMYGEDFDAGLECPVDKLLSVVVYDVTDGVPDSG